MEASSDVKTFQAGVTFLIKKYHGKECTQATHLINKDTIQEEGVLYPELSNVKVLYETT